MTNSNTTSAELKKQFKAEVRQLIEINSSTSTTPKWMTELQLRRLTEQYGSLSTEREGSESKIITLQRELRDSKKMNIALSASAPTKPVASSAPSTTIEDEIEEFLQFKKDEWKDRSYTQNKSNLIRFSEIIGMDRTCSSLTRDDMRYYLSVLKKLPKNIGKLRKVTDLHSNDDICRYWKDAAENNSGESLSLPGVEKHLTVVRGFLLRLHSQGFTQSDLTPFLRQGKKL